MKALAHAKLNLTLEALGRRADGYHEVRTVMQAIDLSDRLQLDPAPELQVECSEPSLAGAGNLVWQAAQLLAQRVGQPPRARIRVEKRIPVGMGLGGGSSDAAAALLALNRLWNLNLPPTELTRLAADLGSDVAFFLQGGAALAQGRGESIEPLPSLPGTPLSLICPAATLTNKTSRLYRQLSPAHYSDGGITRRLAASLLTGRLAEDQLHNVFEVVALTVFPGLEELYQAVLRCAGRKPHLTGAGPALFCFSAGREEHTRLADALQPYGVRTFLVHTLGRAGRRSGQKETMFGAGGAVNGY